MRNKIMLEELSTQISLLVERYNREKEKNRHLSQELFLLRNKVAEQNEKISRLEENERLRGMERNNIAQKISKLLT